MKNSSVLLTPSRAWFCARDPDGRPAAGFDLHARRMALEEINLHAAPSYIARRGMPLEPDDLFQHDLLCLSRQAGGGQPWILTRGKTVWQRELPARLAANSPDLLARIALRGDRHCGELGPIRGGACREGRARAGAAGLVAAGDDGVGGVSGPAAVACQDARVSRYDGGDVLRRGAQEHARVGKAGAAAATSANPGATISCSDQRRQLAALSEDTRPRCVIRERGWRAKYPHPSGPWQQSMCGWRLPFSFYGRVTASMTSAGHPAKNEVLWLIQLKVPHVRKTGSTKGLVKW